MNWVKLAGNPTPRAVRTAYPRRARSRAASSSAPPSNPDTRRRAVSGTREVVSEHREHRRGHAIHRRQAADEPAHEVGHAEGEHGEREHGEVGRRGRRCARRRRPDSPSASRRSKGPPPACVRPRRSQLEEPDAPAGTLEACREQPARVPRVARAGEVGDGCRADAHANRPSVNFRCAARRRSPISRTWSPVRCAQSGVEAEGGEREVAVALEARAHRGRLDVRVGLDEPEHGLRQVAEADRGEPVAVDAHGGLHHRARGQVARSGRCWARCPRR